MRRLIVGTTIWALAALLAVPGLLRAQGYGVYEQGSCMMARAGTGVAAPCADGSTIFFNPAGLGLLERGRTQISGGATIIAPSGDFTDDNTGIITHLKDAAYLVPHLYVARGLTDRIGAGIGLFVPYGLTTEWPRTFDGRFLGYKSRIAAVYVQPTAAFKVNNRLSIGAGVDLSFVDVELRQRIDLAEQQAAPGLTFGNLGFAHGTDFADAKLTGNATGVGYNVGIHLKATDRLSFGVRYLSRQLVEINDGEVEISQVATGLVLAPNNPIQSPPGNNPGGLQVDALVAPQFQTGGPLTNQGASTFLRLPEQFVIGTALQVSPQFKLLFDYQLTNWEVFEKLVLTFDRLPQTVLVENYRTAHGFRLGGEYDLGQRATARLGFLTHGAAAPDETVTPNLPEGRRSEVTAGLGFRLTNQLRVDLAYQYIDQAIRRGRTGDGGLAVPTPAVNNGLYSFDAQLFGATFALNF